MVTMSNDDNDDSNYSTSFDSMEEDNVDPKSTTTNQNKNANDPEFDCFPSVNTCELETTLQPHPFRSLSSYRYQGLFTWMYRQYMARKQAQALMPVNRTQLDVALKRRRNNHEQNYKNNQQGLENQENTRRKNRIDSITRGNDRHSHNPRTQKGERDSNWNISVKPHTFHIKCQISKYKQYLRLLSDTARDIERKVQAELKLILHQIQIDLKESDVLEYANMDLETLIHYKQSILKHVDRWSEQGDTLKEAIGRADNLLVSEKLAQWNIICDNKIEDLNSYSLDAQIRTIDTEIHRAIEEINQIKE
jgi:hypothetical protein